MDLMKPVSGRQFAKMVGIKSDNAVRTAVDRQSIIKGKTADGKFIPLIAAREWGKEILPEYLQAADIKPKAAKSSAVTAAKKPPAKKTDPTNAAEFVKEMMDEPLPKVTQEEVDEFDESAEPFNDSSPKTEAERRTTIFKAKMAEIAYLEKKGDMIPRQKMRVLFDYGVQIRTAMMSIPDRVIDNILAADDRQLAKNILTEEIYKTLNALSDPEQFQL